MDANGVPYQRLSIYQTKARLYIVGFCKLRNSAALLKISKQEPTQLDVAEVAGGGGYSLEEVRGMLGQIHAANAHLGGLQLVTHCCGIIGCFRFTETFYLLLVTRKAHVGSLAGGHRVYTVAATALVPLHPGHAGAGGGGQPAGAAEKRYVKLLMGMDLTKHFYFSYTYNLAATLQENVRAAAAAGSPSSPSPAPAPSVYDSMFVWNAYLTSSLRRALGGSTRWSLPLVHGFWEQRRLSIYGRPLTVTLIARRSRHFAGTRFRKRGLNDGGKVANEVETEQVVDAGTDYRSRTPIMSSVVQVRGSVPLFWSQQLTALSPKPEIVLQQYDPLYEVTEAHFADLEARYGAPCVLLNLLKSKERRPRELLLRRELAAAIAMINGQRGRGRPHLVYIPWDFSKHAKQSGDNLLAEVAAITRLALDMTGLFVHNPAGAAAAAAAAQRAASAGSPPPPLASVGSGGGGGGYAAAARHALARSAGGGGSHWHLAAAAEAAAAATARDAGATAADAAAASAGAAALSSPGRRTPLPSTPPPTASTPFASSRAAAGAAAAAAGGGVGGVQWQSGVLRTNCIDCLDRTNVAQYAFGLVAFGRQLYKLGLHDVREVDADSSAAFVLMALYEAMGHVLSLQYGGSEAHTIFFQRKKGEWEASMHSKDLVTSIKRLYSNTYTDAEKQDAINLFLGNFVPQPGQPHLWQLDTDQYLHSETTLRPPPPPPARAGGGGSAGGSAPPSLPVSRIASVAEVVPPASVVAAAERDGGEAAAAAAAAGGGGGIAGGAGGFLGLPSEAPLPLDVSSDDDDDARRRSYHAPDGAAPYAAYASSAIPFHRAPSSGGFFASIMPSFGRAGGGSAAAGAVGGSGSAAGGGLFERVVSSLLAPGGAGAAARAAAAGVGGGDLVGSGGAGRQLLSFDQALARAPNQVWSIRLHGEDDRQGRWAAVQAAFSFFWTSGAAGGAGEGGGGRANNYQLDDAPRPHPPPRLPPTTPFAPTSGRQLISPAAPSSPRSPRTPAHATLSGFTSLPLSPETSRHGGGSGGGGGAAAAGAVPRTVTAGTDGGVSAASDGGGGVVSASGGLYGASPLSPPLVTAGGSGAAAHGGRARHLGQILESMVDLDHMEGHHDHGTTCRTVADTVPALGGGGGSAAGGGDDADDDVNGAYYYSAADAEAAAAGQIDSGGGGVRQGTRTVASLLGGGLLGPSGGGAGQTAGGFARQSQAAPSPAPAPIPELNDFIEVAAPGGGGGPGGGRGGGGLGWAATHLLDPATRRRAAAEAAARAREEERQRKLLTCGLEVSELLGVAPEDLGLHWELQPWWDLEPRPAHAPRPYEPSPAKRRARMAAEAAREARELREAARRRREEERRRQAAAGDLMSFDSLSCSPSSSSGREEEEEGEGGKGGAGGEERLPYGGKRVPYGVPYTGPDPNPPVRLLAEKARVEGAALLHFQVAAQHAAAKYGDFLAAVPQPYGLYGEERRATLALYESYCYVDRV